MQLSPVSEVPDGGAGVGLFPPAVPASRELTPVPKGPDVDADMHLAYHANVTMRGAARISGRVIFIAGFSMCALLVAVLGIVVALCKLKGVEAQQAENTALPWQLLGLFPGHVAEFELGS
jgi:hypothetical protein